VRQSRSVHSAQRSPNLSHRVRHTIHRATGRWDRFRTVGQIHEFGTCPTEGGPLKGIRTKNWWDGTGCGNGTAFSPNAFQGQNSGTPRRLVLPVDRAGPACGRPPAGDPTLGPWDKFTIAECVPPKPSSEQELETRSAGTGQVRDLGDEPSQRVVPPE
jgi:hypothetical protein